MSDFENEFEERGQLTDKVKETKDRVAQKGKDKLKEKGKEKIQEKLGKSTAKNATEKLGEKAASQAGKKATEAAIKQGAKTAVSSTAQSVIGAASAYALPVIIGILILVLLYVIYISLQTAPSALLTTIKKYFNSVIESVYNMLTNDEEKFGGNEVKNIYLTADYLRKKGFNLYNDGIIYEKAPQVATGSSESSSSNNEGDEKKKEEKENEPIGKEEELSSKLTSSDRYVPEEGIYVNKNNNIRYLNYKNSPLFYYSWINGYTYFINADEQVYHNLFNYLGRAFKHLGEGFADVLSGNDSEKGAKQFQGLIVPVSKSKTKWDEIGKKFGKLDIISGIADTLAGAGEFFNRTFLQGDPKIHVNLDDYTMNIKSKKIFGFSETMGITYDLQGWSGRYGLPINFIMALHKTTNAPDFVTEMIKGTKYEGDKYKKTLLYMDMQPIDTDLKLTYKSKGLNELDKTIEAANPVKADQEKDANKEENKKIKEAVKLIENKLDLSRKYLIFSANGQKKITTIQVTIDRVNNHWFRDIYFNGQKDSPEVVKYDTDYFITSGELWAKQNENGPETETLDKDWTAYKRDSDKQTKVSQTVKEDLFEDSVLKDNPKLVEAIKLVGKDMKLSFNYKGLAEQVEDGRRGITNERIKDLIMNHKWYIYNGTSSLADKINEDRKKNKNSKDDENNPLKKKIDFGVGINQAAALLKQSKDIDSEYAYKDLKELLVELKYFKKEDLRDGIREVMQWPLKKAGPGKSWPSGKETKDVAKYGVRILSKEAIKELYLEEANLEIENKINLKKLALEDLQKQALDEYDDKKYSELKKKIKAKEDEIKKSETSDERQKAREKASKKYEEMVNPKLDENEENSKLTDKQKEAKLKKKAKNSQKNDPIFKKLYSRYGEGYDEKDFIVAPATGKVSYKGDTVEIKVLDANDVKDGNLPEGYKEFYETEYKGVNAGYTIKIKGVEQYQEPKEEGSNKTAYKRQISKSEISKLSSEEERKRVEEIEKKKMDAVARSGEYVKEGTIIAKPKMSTSDEKVVPLENENQEGENNKKSKEYVEKTETGKPEIVMTMADPDKSFVERLPEYIVKRSHTREQNDTNKEKKSQSDTDTNSYNGQSNGSSSDLEDPNDVEQKLFDHLTNDLGFSGAAASGILAVVKRESSFQLDAQNLGGGVAGLFQWSGFSNDVNGNRITSEGSIVAGDVSTLTYENQMKLLDYELSSKGIKKDVKSIVGSETDPFEAAKSWSLHFEGVSLSDGQTKLDQLREDAEMFNQKYNSDNIEPDESKLDSDFMYGGE